MIQTARFNLRPFLQTDIEDVFRGLSHPDVIRYYGVSFATLAATQEQMDWFAAIERENAGRWRAICSTDNRTFYGAAGFNNWNAGHRRAEAGVAGLGST